MIDLQSLSSVAAVFTRVCDHRLRAFAPSCRAEAWRRQVREIFSGSLVFTFRFQLLPLFPSFPSVKNQPLSPSKLKLS
jgi:hypothetical protein